MNIKREIFDKILLKLEKNKVVILYGPRRTGKTTIINELSEIIEKKEKVKKINGDLSIIQNEFSAQSLENFKNLIGDAKVLIIDEAQRIENIGLSLKIIVDNIKDIKIIATGSASLDLLQKVGEPLTGRKKTMHLFPISAKEIIDTKDIIYYKENLENFLIYGTYPELFNISSNDEKKEYLLELTDSYLFKDILELEQVKNSKKLRDLLTLIAFQIGKEVSLNELANSLDIHVATVSKYLDLLEKSFILINLRGFSRNLRKEVTKTSRYYFYDLGIRNAIINNFNPINLRDDIGGLWENYIIIERIKRQSYKPIHANNYFWRTYDKQEIDFIEERGGKLYGFEIKWGDKMAKVPVAWKGQYKNSEFEVINNKNFLDFIV